MYGVVVQVESGRRYDLDMSLFERLVKQGHPVATLQQQRRMRPSISSLVCDTIYPHLQVVLLPDSASACLEHCSEAHRHAPGLMLPLMTALRPFVAVAQFLPLGLKSSKLMNARTSSECDTVQMMNDVKLCR